MDRIASNDPKWTGLDAGMLREMGDASVATVEMTVLTGERRYYDGSNNPFFVPSTNREVTPPNWEGRGRIT
jgi:hypothetical protein